MLDNPTPFCAFVDLQEHDSPGKALGVCLCGHLFLKAFHITGDDEDVCQAIKAFKEVADCLTEDNPRLGEFLNDVAHRYQACYEKFGLLDDLEEAITTRQKGVATTAEGDPSQLNSLRFSYFRCFKQKGDMQDISDINNGLSN